MKTLIELFIIVASIVVAWGSESVIGVIKKAQIIGKVKGYYDPLALYPLSNG